MSKLQEFVSAIKRNHPMLNKTLAVCVAEGGVRLESLAEDILHHYSDVAGEGVEDCARKFAAMVLTCNKLQYQYEISGAYKSKSYADVKAEVYEDDSAMNAYMAFLVCSQFGWLHHFKLWCFFEDQFVANVQDKGEALEIAPGHGYFGITLLRQKPNMTLKGIDISPTSVGLSQRIAIAMGQDATAYSIQDATQLPESYAGRFAAIICGELLEHVPQPELVLSGIHDALSPDGKAYVTAAITAAAPDHIYEFETPEDVLAMASAVGFNVVDSLCEGTQALTEKAKGAPRTLAMILQKD